jgi:hypothetical protein
MLFLVANPVGLVLTGLVAGLVALGMWVSNNWEGAKSFFSALGNDFMGHLGPAGDMLRNMVGYLQSAYNWLSQLLGPLDQSSYKWAFWGDQIGGAAGNGVKAIVSAIQKLIGFFESAYNGAVKLGGAVKNMLGFGGSTTPTPAGGAAPAPIAGARALGGPVLRARPHLVGEHGPELFVPGMSGWIETNDRLRRLTADGAALAAGSTTTTNRTYSLNPTINIMGGDDPRAIAGQVRAEMERYLRDLEAEQRGLLSD